MIVVIVGASLIENILSAEAGRGLVLRCKLLDWVMFYSSLRGRCARFLTYLFALKPLVESKGSFVF